MKKNQGSRLGFFLFPGKESQQETMRNTSAQGTIFFWTDRKHCRARCVFSDSEPVYNAAKKLPVS